MTDIEEEYMKAGREWRLEYKSLEGLCSHIEMFGTSEKAQKRYAEIRKKLDILSDKLNSIGKQVALQEGLVDE